MARTRVGRNDPCPCGSGKKYKRCCLKQTVPLWPRPPPIPPELIERFREHQRREQERKAKFGLVRPPIATDFHRYKFVAAGNKLYYSKDWKFFPDFLLDYVPSVFGQPWGKAELAKPFNARHTLVQWKQKCVEFLNKQQPSADGSYAAIPNGFVAAYFAFAYDLYVVADNGRLDGHLLTRLKHPDQFQGARHELFAEATCLRAGFTVEQHEDEKDRSSKHAEFTAIHKQTGQRISVEAKSKHRPGVLGRPGRPEPPEKVSLRFGALINDAIRKNPPHPLVIFVDTNLPPAPAEALFRMLPGTPPRLAKHLSGLFERIRRQHSSLDPYVLLVLTNHPHHYANEDEADPRKHLISIVSQVPKAPANMDSIMALHWAAKLYGNIPNEFPSSD